MERLKAYKTDTAFFGTLDHTYVWAESIEQPEDPKGNGIKPLNKWGCMGGDDNGIEVKMASGLGALERAIKLAGKSGGHHDGILYGINGVCHTMSNRVLAETRCIVNNDVRGGAASMMYGYYGIRVPAAACLGVVPTVIATMEARKIWIKRCNKAGIKPLMRAILPRQKGLSMFVNILQDMYYTNMAFLNNTLYEMHLAISEARHMIANTLGLERAEACCQNVGEVALEMAAGTGSFKHLTTPTVKLVNLSMEELACHLNYPFEMAMKEFANIFNAGEYRELFMSKPGDEIRIIEPELLTLAYGDINGYVQALETLASNAG